MSFNYYLELDDINTVDLNWSREQIDYELASRGLPVVGAVKTFWGEPVSVWIRRLKFVAVSIFAYRMASQVQYLVNRWISSQGYKKSQDEIMWDLYQRIKGVDERDLTAEQIAEINAYEEALLIARGS